MKRVVAFAAFVIILAGADHAQAQSIRMGTFRGFLTGHVGLAAGGELSDPRLTAGGSVSVQEQDGWGAELDFGRADDALASGQELDITTYMVNGSWVRPDVQHLADHLRSRLHAGCGRDRAGERCLWCPRRRALSVYERRSSGVESSGAIWILALLDRRHVQLGDRPVAFRAGRLLPRSRCPRAATASRRTTGIRPENRAFGRRKPWHVP
jgi:hypothetical protein